MDWRYLNCCEQSNTFGARNQTNYLCLVIVLAGSVEIEPGQERPSRAREGYVGQHYNKVELARKVKYMGTHLEQPVASRWMKYSLKQVIYVLYKFIKSSHIPCIQKIQIPPCIGPSLTQLRKHK
jgi:hypothetical protein